MSSIRVVVSCLLLCAGTAVTADANRWIHDDTANPPRLSVEQAIWAMGGLPRGGEEWTLAEKISKIAAAGFDGFMVFLPRDAEEQDLYRDLAREAGLEITLQCAPSSVEELAPAIVAAKRMGARGLVAMIRPTFVSFEDGKKKIQEMSAACAEAGLPFYVETHRGTITQDIVLTRRWAETIPGIQFHADLSHFVISYEIGHNPGGELKRAFDAVLSRTGMIDGRVSNGEQVQIDVGPAADTPDAKRFAGWWKQAMLAWLDAAKPGDVFVFKSELGPPGYAITGTDGAELSDRWEQSIVLRDLAIRTWNEAVRESGKGSPYAVEVATEAPETTDADAPASTEAAEGGGLDSAEAALTTAVSPVTCLRGETYRIGDFHLGGQPLQPDLDDAKEKGIKSVINLRLDRELGGLGFDEGAYLEYIGLEYRHFPTGPDSIDDALAEKILAAMKELPKPLYIHDSNSNRAWGVWALYAGVEFGVPVEKVAALASERGAKRLVIDAFVKDYLARKGEK